MSKTVIELQNIRRDFQVGDETVHALRGVSFSITEGEFVTIMGTSGSGKSTLLNTWLPRYSHQRRIPARWHIRTHHEQTSTSHPAEPEDRLCFRIQPVGQRHCRRECRVTFDGTTLPSQQPNVSNAHPSPASSGTG